MLLLAARLMPLVLNMPGENKIEVSPILTPDKSLASEKLEASSENIAEKKEAVVTKKTETPLPSIPNNTSTDASLAVSSDYDRRRIQAIDVILAEGLDQVFLKMSPKEQQIFKSEGEKTAVKINQLLDKAKVGVAKIIILIRRWLGLIPRVNKFFLEQEAKIKADKILKIKKSL